MIISLRTKVVYLLTIVVGSILTFLSYFLNSYSFLEGGRLTTGLRSDNSRISAVISITLCVPLIIDVVIDLFHEYMFTKNKQQQIRESVKGNKKSLIKKKIVDFDVVDRLEILLMVAGNLLSIVPFLPYDTFNLGLLYVCCRRCQVMLFFGSACCTLHRYNVMLSLPNYSLHILLVMNFISCVLGPFANNIDPTRSKYENIYSILNWIFGGISLIGGLYLCGRWIFVATECGRSYFTFLSKFKFLKINKKGKNSTMAVKDLYLPLRVAYLVSMMLWIVSYLSTAGRYQGIANYTDVALVTNNIFGALFSLAIIAINIQKVKSSALESLVSY